MSRPPYAGRFARIPRRHRRVLKTLFYATREINGKEISDRSQVGATATSLLLGDLIKCGWVTSRWVDHPVRHRVYKLTPKGSFKITGILSGEKR